MECSRPLRTPCFYLPLNIPCFNEHKMENFNLRGNCYTTSFYCKLLSLFTVQHGGQFFLNFSSSIEKSVPVSFMILVLCLDNFYSTLSKACAISFQVSLSYQRLPQSLWLKELVLMIYIFSLWDEPFYILPCMFFSLKYLWSTSFTECKRHWWMNHPCRCLLYLQECFLCDKFPEYT